MSAREPDPYGRASERVAAALLADPDELRRADPVVLAHPWRELVELAQAEQAGGLPCDRAATLALDGALPADRVWLAARLAEAEAGGVPDALSALTACVLARDARAEELDPERQEAAARRRDGDGFRALADIAETRVTWWWPGRLAVGMVSVMAGDGGTGKSTLAHHLVARMTRGLDPAGRPGDEPRGAVLLTAEEHVSAVVAPRLRLMGADLARVLVLDPADEGEAGLALPSGLERVEAACRRVEAGMLVIDTGPALMDFGLRSNSEEHVRAVLAPLARLAERRELVVLALAHLNKGSGQSAGHRIMGGAAWRNAPRTVLLVGPPPGEDARETGERIAAVEKSNLGVYPPAQAFRLGPAAGEPERAIVAWGAEVAGIRADALVMGPPSEEERTEREDAAEALAELLADGPREAREAEAELRKAGHSTATLRRAREALGITRAAGTVYQDGYRGPYKWRLPEAAEPPPDPLSTDAHPPVSTRGVSNREHPCETPYGERDSGAPSALPDPTGAHPRESEHPWAPVSTRGEEASPSGTLWDEPPAPRRDDPDDPAGRPAPEPLPERWRELLPEPGGPPPPGAADAPDEQEVLDLDPGPGDRGEWPNGEAAAELALAAEQEART